MSIETQLLFFGVIGLFIAMILHVVFGQITVRKLRKNPKTKDALGMEFISGWDILNVAGALSRPKWLTRRFKKSNLSFLAADADILYKHTTLFDRILARIFCWSFYSSAAFLMILVILDSVGFWDK